MPIPRLLLAALLLAPLPLGAQPAARPAAAPPGADAAVPEQRGPIRALVGQRAELALSAEQVTRLEQIDAQMHERNRPLVEQMVRIRRELRGARAQAEMTVEQRAEHQRRLEQARPLMEQIRQHNREAMQQVGDVLTDEQKERVRQMMRERESERRQRPHHRGRSDGARDGTDGPHSFR